MPRPRYLPSTRWKTITTSGPNGVLCVYIYTYIYICHINTPKKKHNKKRPEMLGTPKTLMPLLRPYLDHTGSKNLPTTPRHTLSLGFFMALIWASNPSCTESFAKNPWQITANWTLQKTTRQSIWVAVSEDFPRGNICLLILTLTQLSRNSLGHEDGFWCSLNYQVWLSVIQWNQKGNKHFQQTLIIDEYRILDVYQFHVYFGIPWKTLSCLHGNHLLHRHLLCFIILSSSHHGDHSQGVAVWGCRIKQKSYWGLPKKWYDSLCFVEIYLWLKCLVAEIPIQCSTVWLLDGKSFS